MTDGDVSIITLTGKTNLIAHINGLDGVIADRNARIAQLEAKILEIEGGEVSQAALKREYKRGWKACASRMMEITKDAALAMRDVRADAWRAYLEGDDQ